MKRYKDSNHNVTEDGDVVSDAGCVLTPWLDKDGYPEVSIYFGREKRTVKVHRLVAELFVTGFQTGLHVNHKDGDKTNNASCNLEWVTPLGNSKHAVEHQLIPKGSQVHLAILTEEIVHSIKLRFAAGEQDFEIAKDYMVNREAICKIRSKKAWRHVSPEIEYPINSSTKKLKGENIPTIRKLYSEGNSLENIGKCFGVAGGTISGIINGKTWVNY
jgi:hypothetical protein